MNEYLSSIPDFENSERIGYLIASYIKGTLTSPERKELDEWILSSEENEQLFDQLTSEENIQKTMLWYAWINEDAAKERIKRKISFAGKRRTLSFPFAAVAASVILIIGFAAFFLIRQKVNTPNVQNPSNGLAHAQDPLPGRTVALLTLAGGRKVVLDSTAPRTIEQGNIKIEDGIISYGVDASSVPSENLLSTPRGGQYRVVLSDGTRVWLNAESSLGYPTAFNGAERKVVLTGEAYFEVTKNKEKPFIVQSSAGTIKVLGTRFNVNSYGDDNLYTTTLVEGSVQITKGSSKKVLKPGEQARVTEEKIEVGSVDTGEATAWKDGEFVFRNLPVPLVVKQLARWYDLQVEFRDPVDKHLNATIKRDVPLSKVLYYLEQTGEVHFKTEGKKLIVMK